MGKSENFRHFLSILFMRQLRKSDMVVFIFKEAYKVIVFPISLWNRKNHLVGYFIGALMHTNTWMYAVEPLHIYPGLGFNTPGMGIFCINEVTLKTFNCNIL